MKDILQWDVKSWQVALLYWDKAINWNKVKIALELGGRQGGLSLWLALKGIETICSDLNNSKVSAQPLHSGYNINSLIKYEDIDAANIPYENHFDVIIFKSIIGGIGRNGNIKQQEKVFHQVYEALKPGGKLLFAENLIASPLHQFARKKFVRWGNSWRYISIEELKRFLSVYSSYVIKTTGVLAVFGRNEKQQNFLASVDSLLLNKVCPENWKYIAYGMAEK